ncbi:MAG: beta-lactamase family protein [Deltaproteobacteria bacterium]|nr:beta-lactamase family protein [Deltaproteobacteria bacterium]
MAVAVGDEQAVTCFGALTYDKQNKLVDETVLYDLASLTKILATASLAMVFAQNGELRLDAPAGEYLEEIADETLARATVAQLLAHEAGYPAWKPLFRDLEPSDVGTERGRGELFGRLVQCRREYDPGSRAIYSDLDIMTLGFVLERIGGDRLDQLATRLVFEPLGMRDVAFLPSENFARSHLCADRGVRLARPHARRRSG